eukprot:6213603-Pleurochrysis_carterae.AAC.1
MEESKRGSVLAKAKVAPRVRGGRDQCGMGLTILSCHIRFLHKTYSRLTTLFRRMSQHAWICNHEI